MEFIKVKIKSIIKDKIKETYDIKMSKEEPSYIANGFIVHNSGQALLYQNRKLNIEPIKYEHPLLEPITRKTFGCILYQEQVMKIMHNVGKMSWSKSEQARKFMTKSKGKKAFEEVRAEFVRNAVALSNLKKEEAEKLYDVVSMFGSYSFNLTHAHGYSIISYWCAFLKVYYPAFFYKAILKYETDKTQINNYLNDAKENNIIIEYPSINLSEFNHSVKNNKIYSGFSSIKGIGKSISDKIVSGQPYNSFNDFINRVAVSEKILKALIISGAFDEFSINKKKYFYSSKSELKNFNQRKLFDYKKDEEILEFTDIELTKLILELTTLKPKKDIINIFNFGNYDFKSIVSLSQKDGYKMTCVRGIVTEIINKDKLLRTGVKSYSNEFEQHMIYLNLNDGTGNLAIQINPWTYTRYKDMIYELKNKPAVIYGLVSKDGNKIYAELLEVPGVTNDIEEFNSKQGNIIISAVPSVSKKGNNYYRLKFRNGDEGLLFKPEKAYYPGDEIEYEIKTPPFINMKNNRNNLSAYGINKQNFHNYDN